MHAKASDADNGQKVMIIHENRHKYSILAMCRFLNISRGTYYYEAQSKKGDDILSPQVCESFSRSRKTYGTRRIRKELLTVGVHTSRRKIAQIMKQNKLISKYTKAQYKRHKTPVNEAPIKNVVNRTFDQRAYMEVVVSDLTYVRVGKVWNYICVLIDLFNREIIGFSTGKHKDAALVSRAFSSVHGSLRAIQIFHTDRGNEFKNKLIDEALVAFGIERSLSNKGCPYDNAIAEATFKTIKTEFVYGESFETIEELHLEFSDYVNWFNRHRLHSALGYQTPVQFRQNTLNYFV